MGKNNRALKLKYLNFENAEEKKEFNKELFTVVAPKYDIITWLLSFGQDKVWKKRLLAGLEDSSTPTCLDLACGTGDITRLVAGKYPGGDVTGLDLNEQMLTRARKLTQNSRISYIVGDMCNITVQDKALDIVTGSYALRNAPDIKKALSEINRVLKKGGQGAFLDFSKPNIIFFRSVQYFLLKLWGNIWGFVFHRNPDIYGYIADSLKAFPDKKELHLLLEAAGFTEISIKSYFFGFISLITFKK